MLVLEDECEQHRMIPKEVNVEHVFVNPLKPNNVDSVLYRIYACVGQYLLLIFNRHPQLCLLAVYYFEKVFKHPSDRPLTIFQKMA